MKKGLLIFQALTIALAVLVWYGIPMAGANSTFSESARPALADRSGADPSAQAMNCGEHNNACTFNGGQHSHMNECCGFTSHALVQGPADLLDLAWRWATKIPAAFALGPPARPPRIFA